MKLLLTLALLGAAPPSVPDDRHPINAQTHVGALPTVPGLAQVLVTQDNINSTICVNGWTKTQRPPVSYTNAVKKNLMKTQFLPGKLSDYELDHVISLELGGDPRAGSNLWMEPYGGPYGARTKDRIETKLKYLVCAGNIKLVDAQYAIMTDWVAAYQKYIGPIH